MRIHIVGGGVSGLAAAEVLSHYRGVELVIVEGGKLGGNFAAGGLKYLSKTDEMTALLGDLGIVYTNCSVHGGILIGGKVEPYPACLKSFGPERAARIQRDHYRKTRRLEPDGFGSKAMNDPASGPKKALQCDLGQMVDRLARRWEGRTVRSHVKQIGSTYFKTADGRLHPYERMIVTIPLWVLARLAYWEVPDALAMKLNLVQIEPARDAYARWDYVYTPYTPEGLIHRISPRDGGYSCEFNGAWDPDDKQSMLRAMGDLNFLFKDGWAFRSFKPGLPGHLLPLDKTPKWPENVAPLGRFAKWDPRSTLDVVLRDTKKLAAKWELTPSTIG